MRLKDVSGRLRYKNVRKYLIKWDEKSRSILQYNFKQLLRPYWKSHVVYEEFPVYGTKYKVDFLNATKYIAVEVHGNQHFEYNKFFHNNSVIDYFNSYGRDVKKIQWLESNGFTVLELIESDIKEFSLEYIKNKFGVSLV